MNHLVPLEAGETDTTEEISIPTNGDVKNVRKQRKIHKSLSNHQPDQLEIIFSNWHNPDMATQEMLASVLSINDDRIQVQYDGR